MYYTNIGAQAPCYSIPTATLVPATMPAAPGLSLITDHVFAKRYMLATETAPAGLSNGALAGICMGGAAAFFALVGGLWAWIHRRVRQKREPQRVTTFPAEEPVVPMSEASQPLQSPHELASPEQQAMSPRSPRQLNLNLWSMTLGGSSPPAYDAQRAGSTKAMPQELPGSTYLHEHHPAFNRDEPPSPTSPTKPKTPTRSFTGSSEPVSPMGKATPKATRSLTGGSEQGSPLATPSSSTMGPLPVRSPQTISPLNSPKLPPGRRL